MKVLKIFIICFLAILSCNAERQLYFCGQPVPIHDPNVRQKFFQIVKSQIGVARLAHVRANFAKYSWFIRKNLQKENLPMDLQYLPIVESNFQNWPKSNKGAAGLWQIMPDVAIGLKLQLTPIDQRLDPNYSTPAACKLLSEIKRTVTQINGGKLDWALVCAAYNFGSGNVQRILRQQRGDYFNMSWNSETGKYVYKILAIKELFEHPEDYLGKQDYDLFKNPPKEKSNTSASEKIFTVEGENGNSVEVEPMEVLEDKNGFNLDYDEPLFPVKEIKINLNNTEDKRDSQKKTIEESTEINQEGIRVLILGVSESINDGDLVELKFMEDFKCGSYDKKKNDLVKVEVRMNPDRMHISICDYELYFQEQRGVPRSRLKLQEILKAKLLRE